MSTSNSRQWWEPPEIKEASPDKTPQAWWLEAQRTLRPARAPEEINALTIAGKENYRRYLQAASDAVDTDPFPHSKAAENPLSGEMTPEKMEQIRGLYLQEMEEYEFCPQNTDKSDISRKTLEGHKLHLNVPIEHVRQVSKYLKEQNYYHKYLHGGDPDDGKIFTLYVGSFDLANRLAKQISIDLGPYLAKPVARREVEYAPNVVGRFHTEIGFSRYGSKATRGMNDLNGYGGSDTWDLGMTPRELFKITYDAMAEQYGSYFYGDEGRQQKTTP